MDKKYQLVMYSRAMSCPFVTLAKRVLDDYGVAYQEIYTDKDPEARQRVIDWTGFNSVPTLVAAEPGSLLPFEAPAPLERGASPRGIDRGAMITEPNIEQFTRWLRHFGFITEEAAAD